MNSSSDVQNVSQTLHSVDNPTAMVIERLYRHAFDVVPEANPYENTAYRHLENLEPVKIGAEFKGDAVEFMNGTIQGTYHTLQSLVKRLADSIDTKPFPGEHITAFIERVADTATKQMLEA